MDILKAEFQQLSADKRKAYREYRETIKAMQEIVTVKSNIDHLLGLTDMQKNKEMSDSDMTQHEEQSADFGPIWLEVTGFWAACPNK